MRLSVIIPTWQAEKTLAATLSCMTKDDDVIIVDGGSTDNTQSVACRFGVRVITSSKGRGVQLNAGAAMAECSWLLFLHADTHLAAGWREEVTRWCARPEALHQAAVFRFALDDTAWQARVMERLVALRVQWFGLPYGDQGLLINRALFDELGLYAPLVLMEDVDAVMRIGKKRLHLLPVAAHTSALRWQAQGWVKRGLRNLLCLALFRIGAPLEKIVSIYEA